MKTRRILSTILALTMLLTLFGGEFASAAGMKIVTAGEELAYDPLAEGASVAYEQHDAGYAVSLDRAADSVTMHVTAVPGSRGADKARLYVRTGVALKAGTTYRVSFALSSEQKLADYTVNFDGDTAAAYGKLDKRSVDAGATDRVEYTLTPKAASGELVLRLLLGKTEVNTLRFSDLAVEEAPAEQSGANKLLVDKLNYAAPGAIRCAAEAGYSAEMTSTDSSATMSITNVPSKDAAVWKLKLMVATGLKPEPGKTYRFRATLSASNSGSYEVCYNEGEVEKGYDVLYNQSLKRGNQTVERMIYVPTDKENPGELIVQFSLGKLSKGTKVTVSKVTVEEASPAYTNALAKDFALDFTEIRKSWTEGWTVLSASPASQDINWTDAAVVSKSGDNAGYLNVDKASGAASLEVTHGSTSPWEARFNIDTGVSLTENIFYRVSFDLTAAQAYSNYYILFGTGFDSDGMSNDKAYQESAEWIKSVGNDGKLENRSIGAGQTKTEAFVLKGLSGNKNLMISLFVGASGANDNKVTVSNLKIEQIDTNSVVGGELAHVKYPNSGHGAIGVRCADMRASSSITEDQIELKVEDGWSGWDNDKGAWRTKLYIKTNQLISSGKYYAVSFDIKGETASTWEINYGKDGDNKGYGALYASDLPEIPTNEYLTVTQIVPGHAAGKLWLILCLGHEENNTYWVKNIRIKEIAVTRSDEANSTLGSSVDDDKARIDFTVNTAGEKEDRQLQINSGVMMEAGRSYRIRALYRSTEKNYDWSILYGISGQEPLYSIGNNNSYSKEYWEIPDEFYRDPNDSITANNNGELTLICNFGAVAATYSFGKLWITTVGATNTSVGALDLSAFCGISEYYEFDFVGDQTGDGTSTVFTASGSSGGVWTRRLYVDTGCNLECGKAYQVSYVLTGDDNKYEVFYLNNALERFEPRKDLHPSADVRAYTAVANESGRLRLMFQIGELADGNTITISGISVKECAITAETAVKPVGSVVAEKSHSEYSTELMRAANQAQINVTASGLSTGDDHWKDYGAKLYIRTGVTPRSGAAYRVSCLMTATQDQAKLHMLCSGKEDKTYDGKYDISLKAHETTPITHLIRSEWCKGNGGELVLQFLLGLLDNPDLGNSFIISDVTVEEVNLWQESAETTGTVTNDMQDGYTVPLTRAKDSATVSINKTPATGMEAWKHKLFLDTGVNVSAGEAYRVVFDTLAENDMDFEVCYNRGSTEKGFTAVYGLHAAAGKTKTVEKMVFAESSGKLIVQLSLGNVPAPNKVTVSNLRVDRAKYSYSGKSALPAEISYQAGDVSYWAHADYDARFTNTADAVTAHITPPAKSPEPWKVKLFLDTGVVLEGGKYYKVTADVSAKKSQNYEICYNNGGVEFGYDSMGGLKATGGKTERIEKLISVPAGKKDTNNLMLQFNLGKTSIANEVTIGGVTVEEVTLAYADALGKDFSYQKSLSTWTDPKTSYKAAVDSAAEGATLHISDVPASGTGVWMVKLFVHTGAMLKAGKSYQVSADLLAAKAQDFETCFNNEETEKGFDAIYGQKLAAGVKTTVDKRISVPASMTDAGELVLQFSVGGAVANDITLSNVSVQELQYGGSGDASPVPDTVIALDQSAQAAGTLDVTREKLTYRMTKIAADAKDNAIQIAGADLRSGDLYTVAFTAKASKELTGTLALAPSGGKSAVISKPFTLTTTEQTYSFTTADALAEGGGYDIFWQFGSADNQKLGSADVELSGISVSVPAERLEVVRSVQKVTVNGKAVSPDIYNINGSNYFKLRDLAVLLGGTNGQFVVRYDPQTNGVSLTTDKAYTPIGGELTTGPDLAATCVRSPQDMTVNGKAVNLKVYNIGGSNFFRLRDLNGLLGFDVDYEAKTNTVLIASPLTPERQEASYAYNVFFRPEIDGESQPYVGDTMPFYDNGTYYIYYLKEGGDSYNHSVYLTTTRDFVSYQEHDDPVLSASRADVQDSWIGTGSVVKVDKNYYFFYTGFNASGSQEYHEKIMVAKGSSPTSFTKVGGWSITPPTELNQKNDFRDPQAYYDPATGTISLTVTASKDGTARILKYTLGKDLSNVKYDGVIFTDPTGAFYNLECSDTFRLGSKWYLTYSGQEDTLWYASADSRFGPYSAPRRMDGTLFYAAKHVENGKNSYMVGWTRRSASASSTDEVSGWGGNLAVQQLRQNADGSLSMIPADSIASAFSKSVAPVATSATLTAGSGYSYKKAFTSSESFKLTGEFTCTGTGPLGLAFDFDGTEDQYKLISVDPAEGKLKLLFNGGATQIAETQAKVAANQKHTFTYIQDGSVGIFYLDGQAALTVRLYGVTDKPIYLFAENNSVTFTSLQQFTR